MDINEKGKIFQEIIDNVKRLAINELDTVEWYEFSLQFKIGIDGNPTMVHGATLEGITATPFEKRSLSDELKLCQNYYKKNYQPEQKS